jgi:hypothetical protein
VDGATAITTVGTDFLNVGGTISTAQRARILRAYQRFSDRLWGAYGWSFKFKTGTVSITAGLYTCNLPTDFLSFGKQGSVSVTSPAVSSMEWAPETDIGPAINVRPWLGVPRAYTLSGESAAGVRVMKVYPAPSVDTTLTITYVRRSPTIVDSTAPSGMEEWPEQYHMSVLYEGACTLLMRTQGDRRSGGEQRSVLAENIQDMWKNERVGQESSLYLPSYGAGFVNSGEGWL